MDKNGLKPLIEALIFAADHPVSLERIAGVLEGERKEEIKAALVELKEDYGTLKRGITFEEVAGGYQFRTHPEHAPWIKRLFKIGMQKISRAAMETLAIVAYKQPITRVQLEEVRGVDSSGVLKTLLDRRLVKITGRKDTPGRPVVYGTTKEFLEVFDLKDLSSLPTLKDIEILEEEYGLEEDSPEEAAPEEGAPEEGASGGDPAREASEGNSQGRDSIEAEGRGVNARGEGQGKREDDNDPGDEG
jgi:segregation and condensation protein B